MYPTASTTARPLFKSPTSEPSPTQVRLLLKEAASYKANNRLKSAYTIYAELAKFNIAEAQYLLTAMLNEGYGATSVNTQTKPAPQEYPKTKVEQKENKPANHSQKNTLLTNDKQLKQPITRKELFSIISSLEETSSGDNKAEYLYRLGLQSLDNNQFLTGLGYIENAAELGHPKAQEKLKEIEKNRVPSTQLGPLPTTATVTFFEEL